MNRKVFVAGFGPSLLCWLVCVGYGSSPVWGPTVLAMFEGYYVDLPTAMKVTGLLFVLLNLPAVLAEIGLESLGAFQRLASTDRALFAAVSS